ncbi:MAG TPA: YifB family Mg chelatase-like AAA ATPase [Micromonosporaceae bacterium]
MGYARVCAVGLVGLAGHVITVEAHVADGLPGLTLTGLPDAALHEARDRVRAAVVNCGEKWPQRRLTVNLLPAELPKRGSGFDLAIAVVVLAASGVLAAEPAGGAAMGGAALIGELGLDGQVRPVRGVLPMVLAAAKAGVRRVVVPAANVAEAGLVHGMTVKAAHSLRQVVDFARGTGALVDPSPVAESEPPPGPDLADVVGQDRGRFALELAAAGRHHLALFGPPGAGKTMLAQRLPSILPPLDDPAALEVTAVHSIAGTLPAEPRLVRTPPFQAPHHTTSAAALVGGGSGLARPGALSLAHLGVLFLDEAPEFGPSVLNSLRQPLEDGWVTLMRSQGTTRYPARVQLVLAANPCPCGQAGVATCECTPLVRRRYLSRLSGPLMDRIDLRVQVQPVGAAALLGQAAAQETSADVRKRVLAARQAAADRWQALGYPANAEVPGRVLRCPPFRLPRTVTAELATRVDRGTLSARGYDRVLRIAWSIVDIDGRTSPSRADVDEAVQLRTGELP